MANEKTQKETPKSMQALINAIREDVSCCCSQHRYDNINAHLDEMQEIYNADKLWYNILNDKFNPNENL